MGKSREKRRRKERKAERRAEREKFLERTTESCAMLEPLTLVSEWTVEEARVASAGG